MLCVVSNICQTHQLYLYLYLFLFFSLYLCIDSINCGEVSPMLSCYLPDKPILDESSHAFFQTGSPVCSHKSCVTSFFVANLYQPSEPGFVFVSYLFHICFIFVSFLFHICLIFVLYLCLLNWFHISSKLGALFVLTNLLSPPSLSPICINPLNLLLYFFHICLNFF